MPTKLKETKNEVAFWEKGIMGIIVQIDPKEIALLHYDVLIKTLSCQFSIVFKCLILSDKSHSRGNFFKVSIWDQSIKNQKLPTWPMS